MFEETPPLPTLLNAIHDPSNPIGMRMRSAYYLRHAYNQVKEKGIDENGDTNNTIIDTLVRELGNRAHGSLMRHEFAYVLGQIQDSRASSDLEACVKDPTDCVMVRHEAAEALGAIAEESSLEAMRQVYENPVTPLELRETCQLSIALVEWKLRQQLKGDGSEAFNDPAPPICACMQTPYSSVDPGLPPNPEHATLSTEQLGAILLQPQETLKDRYQVMFALRNRGGSETVHWLCRALLEDASSALLRHEVAYVLGQIQHPDSVEALEASLRRTAEHKMVRHESAEALGAIDGRWEEVELILTEFSKDDDDVVRESCLVALDAADYWGHNGSLGDMEEETSAGDQNSGASSFAQVKADSSVLVNGHFNRAE